MKHSVTMTSPGAAGRRATTALLRLCLLLLLSALGSGCSEDPIDPVRPGAAGAVTTVSPAFDDVFTSSLRELTGNYAGQIAADFSAVQRLLDALQLATRDLLEHPADETLERAREAWLAAHDAYERTALDRYFANLVLPEQQALTLYQLQYQINAWPILPGYLDSVPSYRDSGIVNDITVDLTPENLRLQHGEFDLAEATLGFHVIEFLLWGLNTDGMAPRSARDYEAVTELRDTGVSEDFALTQIPVNRRRLLLSLVTELLVIDFEALQLLWSSSGEPVAARIEAMDGQALLSLLMTSMTDMLAEELLVRSLYPMLNGDYSNSMQSPYSHSTQNDVSAQLSGLDRLLLENRFGSPVNLDSLINSLSENFTDFFYQNFDASKECLVLLFSTLQIPDNPAASLQAEFDVVECINLIANMIDHLGQIRSSALIVAR